ncbi:amidohydrolase family protein [Carboxydochorda subterranea]|uniref:Amidohydrolase family protein n=1 Tax=Carboxydichorda subterranea TaxID=3109565 RepID=A0ABZ1C1X4_9FIRM|nr:amidohydrolase family protein [Limnochorda sp. L945t]WRP18962.1 amidohydrolase family protein [Limnochorda sp. L945t]
MPYISPGFLDLQLNGFAGLDLNGEALSQESLVVMIRALWATGTALFLPTLVSAPFERLQGALKALADFVEAAPHLDLQSRLAAASIAGIHLEGPYISPEDGPRGAHVAAFVRPPDWDEFCRLQEAASGKIRLITLAPEWPGAIDFIERAVASGVTVAIGHTGADGHQIRAAVAAGARLSTHLGNGAHAQLPRHPNYLWEQLAADDLYATFIPDGFHLPPSVLKSFVRAKGVHRSILITDAVAAAGEAPGIRTLMGREVELTPQGKVQLLGTPYLAGSALRLDLAVANAMRMADLPLADAIRMVTETPAAVAALTSRTGRLCSGMEANLTLFRLGEDAAVEVLATVVKGQVVYTAGDFA